MAYIDIGQLRHRLAFQSASQTLDSAGQPVLTWATQFTVWGSVEDLKGRELLAAQQVPTGQITTKVRIRYRSGVTRLMRILHGSRVLEIAAPPADPDGRRVALEIMCREVT